MLKSTKDSTLSVVQKCKSSRSSIVKLAGRTGVNGTGVGGGFRVRCEFGVEEVGLGDASIDWTVGGPLLRG